MLNSIEKYTLNFKHKLIKLGFELPPVSIVHSNKFKQIDMDYKHMSNILLGKYEKTLYKNATNVLFHCTAKYYNIQNLPELLVALKETTSYISGY
jgi:hypothetical protein